MGRIITPTYRVEFQDQTGEHRMAWNGRATKKRLEEWRKTYNASFEPGGVNDHLSTEFVLHISHARIVHQDTGRVVCATEMPSFEVV